MLSHMKYFAVPAVLASIVCATAFAGSIGPTPDGLIGQFRSGAKRVCLPDARGGKSTCARVADVMLIERTQSGGPSDVKVTAEFNLPDAKVCSFEGLGVWNKHERSLVATDARTGCELAMTPKGSTLRSMVVKPDQCNSPCAGRNWLEGVVLRRPS